MLDGCVFISSCIVTVVTEMGEGYPMIHKDLRVLNFIVVNFFNSVFCPKHRDPVVSKVLFLGVSWE